VLSTADVQKHDSRGVRAGDRRVVRGSATAIRGGIRVGGLRSWEVRLAAARERNPGG
jgi:hypothetical protein